MVFGCCCCCMEDVSRSFWKMKLLLFFAVSCWMFVGSGSADVIHTVISAVEGETVCLPCTAPNNKMDIHIVFWSRHNLEKEYRDPQREEQVFFYNWGNVEPNNHPSFLGRVELKDRNMNKGDVSLVLHKVTAADRGIYECYIIQVEPDSKPETSVPEVESISFMRLSVLPSGGAAPGRQDGGTEDGGTEDRRREDAEDGHSGGLVGLIVAAVIVAVVVVAVMILRQVMKRTSPPLPPAGSDPEQAVMLD